MKKTKFMGVLFGTVLCAATLLCGIERPMAEETATIADGVFIGTVNVGQMTKEEARDAVMTYVDGLMDTTFTLTGESGSIAMTAEDMGVSADVDSAVEGAMRAGKAGNLIHRYKTIQDLKREPLVLDMHLSVDKQKTANKLYENAGKLSIQAVDYSLVRENGSFQIVPGSTGIEVDIVASVYAINDFLEKEWDGVNNEIRLVTEVVEPRGSREELAQVQDLLGSYSTDFSSSGAGRTKNVMTGCSKVNGTVLYPGDEFELGPTIRPFTQENGYELAGSYENGTVVESFGGGICQVATTLYNAVIRAELEITMRYNHSMQVSYVKPSMDAAIAGDYKDLHFKNNQNTPIYIEGYCSGKVIYFNIYGKEERSAAREILFESEVVSEEEPEVKFNLDEAQEVGYWKVEQSAHIGMVARLWKIVKQDGVQQSKDVFNQSTYRSSPKIITIGVKGLSAEQRATLNAAIETKDESVVKETVEALKTPITPEEPTDSEGEDEEDGEDWESEGEGDEDSPDDEEPGSESTGDGTDSQDNNGDSTNEGGEESNAPEVQI